MPAAPDSTPRPAENLDLAQLLSRLQEIEQRLERIQNLELETVAHAAFRAVHAAENDLDTVREGYWAVPWSEFGDLDEALEPWRKARRSEQAL